MENMVKTMRPLRERINKKVLAVNTALMVATVSTFAPALCDDPTMDSIMGKVLGMACSIFRYIGFVLVVVGAGQLILSFKNEDSEGKSRATMVLVTSVALIAMKSLVAGILAATGAGFTIG